MVASASVVVAACPNATTLIAVMMRGGYAWKCPGDRLAIHALPSYCQR